MVNSLEVEDLLALYDDDAVFLPTFSDDFLTNKEGIRGYFEELRGEGDIKVSLDEESLLEQTLSDGLHSISGIYRWRFGKSEEGVLLDARFTFILDLGRSSPVLHHHSSRLPRKL
ncbi:MAG: hypothetical protein VCA36_02605 [Opitutales bacterium]